MQDEAAPRSAAGVVPFGVLGPVVISGEGGGPVSGRLGLALALLVEAFPRAVSADRLLEEVWPDGSGSRGTLQVLVHRLRRRAGSERIVLEAAGYRLDAAPRDIDSVAFEQRVDLGGELAEPDPAAALAELDAALGLWRGEPFGGLGAGNEALATAAARLGELRLDAAEARFAAALALGSSGELVGDLRRLVAEHPLRERLHGQLMLALYRSGRTAEALAAYREARALLVEELGIEPGAELRDLEHAILVEDPVLSAPPAPVVAVTDRRPVQLAAPDPAFVGRDRDLGEVVSDLRAGAAVVAIDGPGGVGKSALALQAAHAVVESFPGGVLYVNLHGATPGASPREPALVLERFARALGIDAASQDVEEASAQFRARTSSEPMLVVLDDAASLAQVRPLLPGHGSAALITSRAVLAGLTPDARRIDVLDQDEAVAMLRRFAGSRRVALEPAAAAGIVAACGSLPLAVRVVGGRLAAAPRRTLTAMLERLEDSRARLDELELDDLAVRSCVEVGLDAVDDEATRLFALLGVVALPHVTTAAAARLADLPLGVARRSLDDLAAAQLLEVGHDERYTMHDLVRLVAQEHAARLPRDEREDAVTRVYAHYLASTRAAGATDRGALWEARERLGPRVDAVDAIAVTFTDQPAAAQWVRTELGALLAIADAVRQRPDGRELVAALAAPLFLAFLSQGLHASVAGFYAGLRGDVPDPTAADAVALVDASSLTAETGRKLELADAAVQVAHRVGDAELLANALNAQAVGQLRAGRFEDTMTTLERAIDICRAEARLLPRILALRSNLALAQSELGRHDEAIATLEAVLADATGLARAETLADIAVNHRIAGRPEQAVDLLEEAVAQFEAEGHSYQAALYMWNHANALRDLTRTTEEHRRRRDSLTIVVRLGLLSETRAEEILAGDPPDDLAVFDGL
ncbi:AfsR/SARP family transcriptional regulator [Occultella kanbiaonis]|uniref:AfsR/SARP family transcriptional regulator n=1 Tax=Occultella kanbiaonis TaxID=2675754 RepID=UPI0013D41FC4|nr:AfsR/SARP family transcriptional regulator [Occultella kanbiaonis]